MIHQAHSLSLESYLFLNRYSRIPTLEEHIRQSAKGFWRIRDTVDYLLYCFQEEFRKTGKDTIDGTTYQMAGDYSNARMNQVILSECNSIDTTEFEKTLEEAEMYLNSKYKN